MRYFIVFYAFITKSQYGNGWLGFKSPTYLSIYDAARQIETHLNFDSGTCTITNIIELNETDYNDAITK